MIREFRPQRWGSAVAALVVVICLVLIFAPIDYAIPMGYIIWDYNIWVRSLLVVVVLYLAAFLFYVLGVTWVLYEGGFTRTIMSETVTVRWSDIKNIEVATTKERNYKITLNTRKSVEFGDGAFKDARVFGEEVIRRWQYAVESATAATNPMPQWPSAGAR